MAKNVVGVAVGKGSSGMDALKYVLENEESLKESGADMALCLLHIYPPVRWVIGTLGDRVRAEHASVATVKKFKDERNRKAEKLINQYKSLCDSKKIKTEVHYAESDEIQKELVELILKLGLTKLVLGASKKNLVTRALKGETVATYVTKNAPNFCSVVVICKGKPISTTDATDSTSISLSSDTSSTWSESHDDMISEYGDAKSDAMSKSRMIFSSVNYSRNPIPEWNVHLFPNTRNGHHRRNTPPIPPMISTGSHGLHSPEVASYQDIYVESDLPPSRVYSNTRMIDQMSPTEQSNSRVSGGTCEAAGASEMVLLEKQLSEAKMSVAWVQREAEEQSKSIVNAEQIVINAKKMIAEAEKRRNIALKEAESAKFQASEDSRRQEEALVALENALKEQELLKKDSENTINALTSRIIAYEKNLDEVRKEAETSKQRYEETLKKLEGLTRELEIETYRRKEAERRALDESIAKQEALEALRSLQQKYTEYTFEELKVATNNFDENNKLGEGGYGPVYKGKLLHTPVAIKVLARDGVYGRNEFQREVELLSRIHHPHLVMLLGACPKEACIVYEYMSNGSLEDCLKGKGGRREALPWHVRFRICAEVATALLFLHKQAEPIAHRDLKPGNILLDHNYVSKIGDVGIAKLVPLRTEADDSSSASCSTSITMYKETVLMGTLAYMDPDYQRTGVVSCECDVYALGIVMLQLLTGRPPLGVAVLVEDSLEKRRLPGILDPSAGQWPIEDAEELAHLSLQCMEPRRKHRPSLELRVLPVLERLRANADDHVAAQIASSVGSFAQAQNSEP